MSPLPTHRPWRTRKWSAFFILFSLLTLVLVGLWKSPTVHGVLNDAAAEAGLTPNIGDQLDNLNGVPVYHNGVIFWKSHGRHYAQDGYYYGQKWQCVEYVKRYYYDHYHHAMPNVWGHARDFYNAEIPSGQLNPDRGLLQFANDGKTAPQVGDLVVWHDQGYGHVAIVSEVNTAEQFINVVQQNILGKPRQRFSYQNQKIGTNKAPTGWLRLP